MHDPTAEGSDFFKCDFCHASWDESRPMVEGHRGSLICGPCLRIAYAEVIVSGGGVSHEDVTNCTMCLSHRSESHWRSPAFPEAVICRWCMDKAATILAKDPSTDWTPPMG